MRGAHLRGRGFYVRDREGHIGRDPREVASLLVGLPSYSAQAPCQSRTLHGWMWFCMAYIPTLGWYRDQCKYRYSAQAVLPCQWLFDICTANRMKGGAVGENEGDETRKIW